MQEQTVFVQMWIIREDVAVSSRKSLGFIEHKLRKLLVGL